MGIFDMSTISETNSVQTITVRCTSEDISTENGKYTVKAMGIPFSMFFGTDHACPIRDGALAVVQLTDTGGTFVLSIRDVKEYLVNEKHKMVTLICFTGIQISDSRPREITVIPDTVVTRIIPYKNGDADLLALYITGDLNCLCAADKADEFDQMIYQRYAVVSYRGTLYRLIKVDQDSYGISKIQKCIETPGNGRILSCFGAILYFTNSARESYPKADYEAFRDDIANNLKYMP